MSVLAGSAIIRESPNSFARMSCSASKVWSNAWNSYQELRGSPHQDPLPERLLLLTEETHLLDVVAIVHVLLVNVDTDASTLRRFLPLLAFGPSTLTFSLELVTTGAQLGNSLFGEQLFESPLLDVLRFVLFELCNKLHGASKNRAFVLLAAWNDLGELVNALIDRLSTSAFNWKKVSMVG